MTRETPSSTNAALDAAEALEEAVQYCLTNTE